MVELTLVIGNKNYSSWSLRPWLFMRERDIAFKEVRLPMNTDLFRREIVRWSPTRRVPVLRAGELAVWDSLAILEYVAERFPESHGWPEEHDARAVARSVSAEMHSGFAALRAAMPMDCRRREPRAPEKLPVEVGRDVDRIRSLIRDCRGRFGEHGPFLFGRFSIADAMYAPVALRFRSYAVEVGEVEEAWMDSLFGLDAMHEWLDAAMEEKEVLASP